MQTTVGATPVDSARAEAFAGRMLDVLNHGFLNLLISVGHQTRLFEVMTALPASTSAAIAEAAGLQERYVREWLGGMVVGRIIEYDAERKTYRFPPEHAACLTSAAGADNFAMFTQYIALCGSVEPQVVDCFRHGGGVPYSAYPRFQQIQGEESAMTYRAKLVSDILPLAPGVVDRLQAGTDVLDLGCGQGAALNIMAQAFPRSRFTGWDFSEEGVRAGREEARTLGLSNAQFEARSLTSLDATGAYDVITTFDVVHDLAAPQEVLRRIARALRRDGIFFMVDIAADTDLAGNLEHALGPTLYAISVFHCMTVSLSQGGPGLGTVWGEAKAVELLTEAGFKSVEVKHLDGDVMHAYYIARK